MKRIEMPITILEIPTSLLFPKLIEACLKDERLAPIQPLRNRWLPKSRVYCKHILTCLWMTEENKEKEEIRRVYTTGNDEDMFDFANFSFDELCRMCRGFVKIGMTVSS